MSDYEYNGPRMPRTRKAEVEVRTRFWRHVSAITATRYSEAVADWGATDEGRFPDREQIQRDVTAEVETLCRALDGWGAVDPDSVFGPHHPDIDFGDLWP